MIETASMVVPASALIGLTTSCSKLVAVLVPSKFSLFHTSPSIPAVIEPPETLEILARPFKSPNSLRRHSVPR